MSKQARKLRFNTQPPEGGWCLYFITQSSIQCFNTQPPEGGWRLVADLPKGVQLVSTHSRLKAAGFVHKKDIAKLLFQHTAA